MVKKLLSILALLCLTVSGAWAQNYCGDPSVNGGQDVTWELTGTWPFQIIKISGTGAMADYDDLGGPWNETAATDVVIEDGVTSIGNNAFFIHYYLNYATIPASVTSIGEQAFYICEFLKSVTVYAANVPSLGSKVFDGCSSSLKIYVFSDKVTDYQNAANWSNYSDKITAMTNPHGKCGATGNESDVRWIYDEGTKSLTIMKVGSTGAMMDYSSDGAPWNSYKTEITSVAIGDGVTSIGDGAFEGCTGLTSIVIPDNVTSIGNGAFEGCTSLTSVTIPASVTTIGDDAFNSCGYNVSSFTLSTAEGSQLSTIGENTFAYLKGTVDLSRSKSLATIPKDAFYGSDATVILPRSVTTIAEDAFRSGEDIPHIYVVVPTNFMITANGEAQTVTDGKADIKSVVNPRYDGNLYISNAVTVSIFLDPTHFSQSGDEYTIHDATGWDVFCDALQDNDTYNRFSGKTVKLGNSISVTRMAGSDGHDFCGTFDGQGYTLTVNFNSNAITDGSTQYVAPFRYVSNVNSVAATIKNLHVTGNITTDMQFAGGLIGGCWGAVSIENCAVSTAITSTISGAGGHGGIVGIHSNGTLTITGCVFDGSLIGTTTHSVGGFIGWRNSSARIYNSLFAPAAVSVLNTSGATFARNYVDTYNCYYTTLLCDGENYVPSLVDATVSPNKWRNGIMRRTVTAGEGVTIALSGTATEYTVSGITAYKDGETQLPGLKYGDVLYAGNEDDVSLTLSNTAGEAPLGYHYPYIASAGTLTGSDNPYTLTMPAEDVTISGSDALRSTGVAVPVSYIDENGQTQHIDAIALDGSEESFSNGAYYVGTDINYTDYISFTTTTDVIVILGDGCTMTVNSTHDYAIDAYGGLTICGQALGSGKLNATGFKILSYSGLTINGGNITAKSINNEFNNITINGGQVSATGQEGIEVNVGDVGDIILGLRNATDYITASSYNAYGNIYVKDGQTLTDEDGNTYSGELTSEQKSAISGKTLYRYIENLDLAANQAPDQNYWTTFYCGHTGYKIKDTENACAYTATYGGSQLTLHKLGKVIPKGTAVIIVGEDNSISMTASTAAAENSVDNGLQGTDIRKEKSTLGTGTFYVMGMVNDNFGFFEYNADYMPARKAYLHVPGAGARELTMVFGEETGIRPTPGTSLNGGEWYDLSGRKLDGKPTKKGLYINNGKKVVY